VHRAIAAISSVVITLIVGVATLLMPMTAYAYSAYGSGTADNPYRIATCGQLEEINNNLSAHYVIVTNIDCTGTSFQHLAGGAPFTGTLDGQNHTIKQLALDSYALFYQTSGATIKNITISSGTVSGGAYLGSFVVFASNTTMQNLHSSMIITGTTNGGFGGGVYVGGIVAQLKDGSSISDSSFSGTITSNDYTGGLVGISYGSDGAISDSYADGTLNLVGVTNTMPNPQPPVFVPLASGGLIGISFTPNTTISRSYSAMTLNVDTGAAEIGGFAGSASGLTVTDSFAANTITAGNGASVGAFFGGGNGTATNNFFDQYLANGLSCNNGGSANCTAENVANSAPGYFKHNTSNGPFGAWDFSGTWSTTAGYPTLQNIANFTETGVPNNDDANGDGVLDAWQPTVASVSNANGVWSTIEIPSNSTCTLGNPQWFDANYFKVDTGYAPQLGTMTAFNVYCPSAGMTVPVTIIYDKQYDTSGSVLSYYNPTTHAYSTVAGAVFGTRTVGGVVKTTVTYNVTDGGAYDSDGLPNGIIQDPVGIATTAPVSATVPAALASVSATTPGAPQTGFGNAASSPLVTLAEFSLWSMGLAAIALVSRKYSKR